MRRFARGRLIRAVVYAMILSLPTATQAQPFGIEMGTKLDGLTGQKQIAPFLFEVNPIRPHPDFVRVVVFATPEHGICLVRGIGKAYGNDAFGLGIQAAFSEIRQQVDSVYGQSALNDFLQPGSIWKEQKYWVAGIQQNERVFQAVWKSTPQRTLPNNASEILLTTSATSMDASYFTLQFRFANNAKCEEEEKKAKARAF